MPSSRSAGFDANQIRFVHMIVNELTANGVMGPNHLFETPFTDHASTGPGAIFQPSDVTSIVEILRPVKERAEPSGAA